MSHISVERYNGRSVYEHTFKGATLSGYDPQKGYVHVKDAGGVDHHLLGVTYFSRAPDQHVLVEGNPGEVDT